LVLRPVPLTLDSLLIVLPAPSPSVLEAVEQHQKAVSCGRRYRNQCRRCEANGGFVRHELRRRQVRLIVLLTVQVLWIVVARWKCSRCGHRFTDLPDFLLPHRRYAKDSSLPLAREYLEHDQRSYQQVAAPQGMVRGYVTREGAAAIDERALHRTTVWRWVTWLGAQTAALQVGMQLWLEHDPLSTLHHFSAAVAPHKFRSLRREEQLRAARRLLRLSDLWDATFGRPFFPRFATRPRDS
jgi:hypothetical protein